MTISKPLERLRKTIAKYSRTSCRGTKAECCTSIMMNQEERDRIDEYLRKKGVTELPRGHGEESCEYLTKDGRCSVYEERPIICRGFGVIKSMNGPCGGCKSSMQIGDIPGLIAYMKSSTIPNECGKRFLKEMGATSVEDLIANATVPFSKDPFNF